MNFEPLWWMLVGHAIADYPLQTDFIAKYKSHLNSLPSVPWYYVLGAHALTHGAATGLATGSCLLGFFETVVHFGIDAIKNAGWTNIHVDQALHVVCKIAWFALLLLGVQ